MPQTAPEQDFWLVYDEDNLPCDDGEPLETNQHRLQMNLLIDSLDAYWYAQGRRDFFVGGNMFLYFSEKQIRKNDFRGPDVFVVLDTERRNRKSWVLWKENQAPFAIIELTSDSTRRVDHTVKKEVYAGNLLRVPLYFIFDPETASLEGFRLELEVGSYLSVVPDARGRFPCKAMKLELGIWHGEHKGYDRPWLRWFTSDGEPIPTAEETAARCAQRAEEQARRAEEQARRAEEEARRAEEEARRAEEQTQRAEEQTQRAEEEAELRHAAEARIAALEAQLAARDAEG